MTRALIAVNVAVFVLGVLLDGGRTDNIRLASDYGLFAPFVSLEGQWWRVITAGFLHSGPIHLIMNMVALWFLGSSLEPALGGSRFAGLYAAGLVSGSLGALLIEPTSFVVGASTAIYGLMGALVTGMTARGVNPFSTGLGPVLLLNLLLTFTIPGISVGGHVGGLIGGALIGWLMLEPSGRISHQATIAVSAAFTIGAGFACVMAADRALNAF